MSEEKSMRLSQAARMLNRNHVSVAGILAENGYKVDTNPNTKLNAEQLEFLAKEFKADALLGGNTPKKEEVITPQSHTEDSPVLYFRTPEAASSVNAPPPAAKEWQTEPVQVEKTTVKETEPIEKPAIGLKILGKIDLDAPKTTAPLPTPAPVELPKIAEDKKVTPVAVVPEEIIPAAPPVIAPKPEVKAVEEQPKVIIEQPKPIEDIVPIVEKVAPIAEEAPKVIETPKLAKEEPRVELTPEPVKATVAGQKPDTAPISPKEENKTQPFAKVKKPQLPVPPNQAQKTKVEPRRDLIEPVIEIEPLLIEAKADPLKGLTILGKIELPSDRRNADAGSNKDKDKKRKRKRVRKGEKVNENAGQNRGPRTGDRPAPGSRDAAKPNTPENTNTPLSNASGRGANTAASNPNAKKGTPANTTGSGRKTGNTGRRDRKDEITDKEVADSIKATNARLSGGTRGKNFGADKRRERRRERAEAEEGRLMQEQEESKVLKVAEFISANELASLMEVSVQEVISVCLSMGMFVSINQRLDAESITLIADEFDYEVTFISAEEEIQGDVVIEEDAPEDLIERAPIVTIMGHVDHGKTSLLDYIRRTRVAAGEAGGITQHIGAYSVKTEANRRIAFLDTPGHEAFTAMRARGAKVTDVVIIVIAADDSIMPQTREAINHAQNAGVPIVFAFSKIDKAGANTEKIREGLANMNILVEEWGGKYQTQEISSKSGEGIPDLLEKVLLEADLLELKANPSRRASGTVIEASLDKGRGYLATILVQTGTLKVGDTILAGAHHGRVKAMFDATGARLKEAGPSTPVQLLGLNGAPQAGDKFNVMENEREARDIANKREQIMREQTIRTRRHITLEEIGRRKAIGTFKELNIIIKGDVDGSVEALSDSLLKLTTEEVQVNIINKAVGQIAESDVNLAIASDAIIVGFQVRPSTNAKKLAEQEQIEIRLYSIIYDAINEVKDAMLGMLEPTMEEVIVGNAEVREVFKISKIGTVAGSYVTDGVIKRNNKVRVIRDFIVVHEGEISQLKRFKDDVNEVKSGFEFGLSIKGLNDILIGDIVESFEMKEVKRTL